ncbi:hypothetical protein HDU93_002271 [Gonapodya sp. JEL0774]|nr:hypothetical protein HDU93_002271 [Gonapodya sp. JEL0774]
MLRSFRGHVRNIAADRHGAEVLAGAMESIDDTVLVSKMMWGEIEKGVSVGGADGDDADAGVDSKEDINRIETKPADPVPLPDGTTMRRTADLALLPSGCALLLHLLAPRNPRSTDRTFLASLERLDPIRKLTTKKDDSVRWRELVKAVSPRILEGLVEGGSSRLNTVVRGPGKKVVVELLKHPNVPSDSLPLLRLLALLAMTPPPKKLAPPSHADQSLDLTTHPLLHRTSQALFKELVTSPLTGLPAGSGETFPRLLLQALAPHMPAWIELFASEPKFTSGAALVVVALVECGDAIVTKGVGESAGSLTILQDRVKEWRKRQGRVNPNGEDAPGVAPSTRKRALKGNHKPEERVAGLTGIEVLMSKFA